MHKRRKKCQTRKTNHESTKGRKHETNADDDFRILPDSFFVFSSLRAFVIRMVGLFPVSLAVSAV
jgi:hypothetical protein